jgi:hypothetical protein
VSGVVCEAGDAHEGSAANTNETENAKLSHGLSLAEIVKVIESSRRIFDTQNFSILRVGPSVYK